MKFGIVINYICYLAVFVVSTLKRSKKDDKDQETIQSSTTPNPGYHMGK